MEGAGFDLEDTHANLATVTDEDVFFKAGLYHGPRDLEIGGGLRLVNRHTHFWHAVGLVAGALMREKTIDGSDVTALVRTAEQDPIT